MSWLLLRKFCHESGMWPDEVERLIRDGKWIEGLHYRGNNAADIRVSVAAYHDWVLGKHEPRRERYRALLAYKADKAKRTPRWADGARMVAMYEEATQRSRLTGTPHHVDHVIPLRGRRVSGLHVPDNLRVIPAVENLERGNNW